jgi:radical SAM superfamily enzyme YgiQ (UPF0313 family)
MEQSHTNRPIYPPNSAPGRQIDFILDRNWRSRRADDRVPEKIIILGGPYPTLNFLEVLDKNHDFDVLFMGESEVTAVELVNVLRSLGYDQRAVTTQSDRLSKILGIVYRENVRGRFTGDRSWTSTGSRCQPATTCPWRDTSHSRFIRSGNPDGSPGVWPIHAMDLTTPVNAENPA